MPTKVELERKIEEYRSRMSTILTSASGPDLVILGLGFYAGWEGVTLIDYFIKDLPGGVQGLQNDILAVETAGITILPQAVFGEASQIWNQITGNQPANAAPSQPQADLATYAKYGQLTADQKQILNNAMVARIALGCLGAIAAYAFTRPGFLPALMQMAGDIVGGKSAVPIAV
jgi:hypothetical protein